MSPRHLETSRYPCVNIAVRHRWTNQDWELVSDGPNYQVKGVHSGKCLDVAVASQANGGTVHQWDCHGGTNQKWEISKEDGTAFVLE